MRYTLKILRRENPDAEVDLPDELVVDMGFLSDGTLALVTETELLLLDEPAAGMNPTEKDTLARLVLSDTVSHVHSLR